VWQLGRGQHTLNPLHTTTGGDPEARRARQLSLLDALISIVRRHDPDPVERRLMAAALDIALDAATPTREATIPDLLRILVTAPARLVRLAGCADDNAYDELTRLLTATLGLLCDGPLRGLFDRPSTVRHEPDSPAVSLDLSALDDADDDVIAAAMLCAWTWTTTHADTDPASGRRNVVQVQDELWRALRVAPGLVEKSDRITRLGRHRGVVSIQVTHSLDDLEALPTEADRAKARGLASRTGVLVLGGMADRELDPLTRITPLTYGERALVTSWAAPPTWHPGHTHPGRGKYLIKSGQRLGLPVALTLTPAEVGLYDTDSAFRMREDR
jgi:hypothetical protein